MTEMAPERVITEDREYREDDDHEKFSHYVRKDALEAAIFSGIPCKALCGKMWLPTRDPHKFPVCPTCKEMYLNKEDDNNDND